MRKSTLIILTMLLFSTVSSFAEIPHLINYQGKLTDSDGKPITGTKSISFRIYDVSSGGTPLWSETQSVTVDKGIFNVLLGSSTDLNLAFDKPYYLGIKVETDAEMSPRQRIASAAYAIRAGDVDSVPRGVIVMWSGKIADIPEGWALCDGTNGTPDLKDRFIVGAKQDEAGIAKTNVSGVLNQTGGEAYHTLTISEIPSHNHTLPGQYRWYDGDEGQSYSLKGGGSISTQSAGNNQPHNNLPPYYAVAFIMKL